MLDALTLHRIHFAITISFHYIFPQLTMGLALLIVMLKSLSLLKKDQRYNHAARFWAKIFAVNFAVGVVTGIPMEFQFGTNWAKFSTFAGGVIGQTLAMEGMFAFFLESSFLGLFLFGEKKLGQTGHLLSAIAVFLGSWISGFFIVATNAWMQHPVGYVIAADGTVQLSKFWELILNSWLGWQYVHTMAGAVVTAAFVMASVGAYYLLAKRDEQYGVMFVRVGVIAGIVFSFLLLFPSGDGQGKNIAQHQPITLAAMEALFQTK
jgi:cytochrome d ubiquinol oxidase subunit I